MTYPAKESVDRIRNRRQDNEAFVRRGSFTVRIDQDSLDAGDDRGPAQEGPDGPAACDPGDAN